MVTGLFQGGFEFVQSNGLGDVVVHAGLEANVAVPLHGVGGHRDDPDAGALRAQAAGGFVAVHLGHLAVHEDDVVGLAFEGFEDLKAVGGAVRLNADFQKLADGDFLIHGIVFGEKDSRACEFGNGFGSKASIWIGVCRVGETRVGRNWHFGRCERREVKDSRKAVLEMGGTNRFGEMRLDAGRFEFIAVDPVAHGSQEDHANVGNAGVGADSLSELEAVHAGHLHVEGDDVERFTGFGGATKGAERFHAIGGGTGHAHAPAHELILENRAVGGVVVHDEDAFAFENGGRR